MFTFPLSDMVGGIRYEHSHRLFASTMGLLTLLLAYWLWRADQRPWVRRMGLLAVVAVVTQGLLGGGSLAVSNVPQVIMTLRAGLGGRYTRHRRIARWTLPIWFYVSVTGVAIYLMLYQFDYS